MILDKRREDIGKVMNKEVENNGASNPMKSEITDKDIADFIQNNKQKVDAIPVSNKEINDLVNKNIDIEGVLEKVFGPEMAKEVIFDQDKPLDRQVDAIIDGFTVGNSELLNAQDRNTLKEFCKQHIDALKGLGGNATNKRIFDLMQHNIRKLIYQNVSDKSLLSGSDHGILHIVK
jgi:hypothetical protein